jgi:hypothetical protein
VSFLEVDTVQEVDLGQIFQPKEKKLIETAETAPNFGLVNYTSLIQTFSLMGSMGV